MGQLEWKAGWSIQTLITMQNIQYCKPRNIQLYNFCWRKQPTWEHRIRQKQDSTKILDRRVEKCIKKNQVEMYQMLTQKRQPNPTTDGGSTQRTAWWTCVPIHPYRSRLLRTLWSERVRSSFEVKGSRIHCRTWLPEHHHQWQRNKLRWSSHWAESFHERVGQN